MSKTKNAPRSTRAPRTELEQSLERVDASDALAKIAADSQKARVLIWQSGRDLDADTETWSRYAVKENDLKIGFATSFDQAMKRAKNKFPAARIDHDAKMTDAKARAMKKKFEATIDAARAEAGKPELPRNTKGRGAEVIKPKKGGGPGKEPATKDDASVKEQIADLLDELRAATDPDDKKRIRRKLRARGHRGGLGKERTTKPAEPDEDDDQDDDD